MIHEMDYRRATELQISVRRRATILQRAAAERVTGIQLFVWWWKPLGMAIAAAWAGYFVGRVLTRIF